MSTETRQARLGAITDFLRRQPRGVPVIALLPKISGDLGISVATAKGYLKDLHRLGRIYPNGDGWRATP